MQRYRNVLRVTYHGVLHCLSQQSAGLASTKLALFAVVDLALGAI